MTFETERKSDMKKNFFLLCLAVCIAFCGMPALAEAPALLEPAGVTLDYAAVERMDLYTVTVYTGAVVPYVEELSFEVDGVVDEVHVSLGSSVQKGDVLISLDEEELNEQADEMRELIAYTRQTYANANEIASIDIQIATTKLATMRANGASEADIIRMQSDIDMRELILRQTQEEQAHNIAKMEEELARLEEKIGKNTLVAPFDGVIVSIAELRKDQSVEAYKTVVYIADESSLMVTSDFISQNTVKNASEIYALIGAESYPLEYVPIEMDEYLSAVFAEAKLTSDFLFTGEHSGVLCGDYAAVCVVSGLVEDALVVPVNALYLDGAGRYVYKVDEDGQRVRVNVHTGATNNLYIQITDGLEEGDLVYVKE